MKKIGKKIFSLLIVGAVAFSVIGGVRATVLEIDAIKEQIDKTENAELIKDLDVTYTTTVDTTENTLTIDFGTHNIVYSFTADYIEDDNRTDVVTSSNAFISIFQSLANALVLESVLDLSGYDGKSIDSEVEFTNTFDQYGLEYIVEPFSFTNTDESSTSTFSGEYYKYFKLSFDTDKIDALMTEYGVDKNSDIISSLVPSLEARNITENSVALYPSIDSVNAYDVSCYIYRSNTIDGEYVRLFDVAVNCSGTVGFVDNNLASGTTYYYKAMVMNGTTYSDALAVTTKGGNAPLVEDGEEIENPRTGELFPILVLSTGLIAGIGLIIYSSKNRKFTRI